MSATSPNTKRSTTESATTAFWRFWQTSPPSNPCRCCHFSTISPGPQHSPASSGHNKHHPPKATSCMYWSTSTSLPPRALAPPPPPGALPSTASTSSIHPHHPSESGKALRVNQHASLSFHNPGSGFLLSIPSLSLSLCLSVPSLKARKRDQMNYMHLH